MDLRTGNGKPSMEKLDLMKMIETMRDFLVEKVDPNFIVLFGSYATGDMHDKSDVDLAFYKVSHQLSAYDVFILAQELASLLNVEKVDLINLNEASTVFKMVILDSGKVIYAQDEKVLSDYETKALGMYFDLNVERKGIVQSIKESGRVYGY